MKNSPLISIIIPVYKVEKYLPDCLDSLLAQTYRNFELLLVDDGSPDNCWEIMQQYAQKDSRIRVFQKENGGVSSARNFGLDRANGDYIGFVDSDDTVEPHYLEWLYDAICVCDVPIAMCSYRCVSSSAETGKRSPVTECPSPVLITEETYSWMSESSGGHCWRMLTQRDVLTDIRFDPTLFYGEDALFFMQEFFAGGGWHFSMCRCITICSARNRR